MHKQPYVFCRNFYECTYSSMLYIYVFFNLFWNAKVHFWWIFLFNPFFNYILKLTPRQLYFQIWPFWSRHLPWRDQIKLSRHQWRRGQRCHASPRSRAAPAWRACVAPVTPFCLAWQSPIVTPFCLTWQSPIVTPFSTAWQGLIPVCLYSVWIYRFVANKGTSFWKIKNNWRYGDA